MYFVITDSAGSEVDSFSDERQAEDALAALGQEGPGEVFFLLGYDDDGSPVGEACLVEDVLTRVSLVSAPEFVRLTERTSAPATVRVGRFALTGTLRQSQAPAAVVNA